MNNKKESFWHCFFCFFSPKKCEGDCKNKVKEYMGLFYLILLMLLFGFQVFQYFQLKTAVVGFMSIGPRFTAEMGQHECERVQQLERLLNIEVQDCNYFKKE